MKILKRLTASILILCLMPISIAAFEAEVTESSAAQSEAMLDALGLWNTNEVSDIVTRGEMTNIMVRVLGMKENLPDRHEEIFFDIPREHPLFKQIGFLCDMDVISADVYFNPDKPLAYAEAIKMLLCAMGYRRYAEERGGYPTGYIRTAREQGLISGDMKLSDADELTKGEAAVILGNAVECKLMEPLQFGDKVSYVFDDNITLLTQYHGIYTVEGILRNAGLKAIDSSSEVRRGRIKVDDKIMDAPNGTDTASEYLGCRVKAYYKETDASAELCYIRGYNNRILRLTDADSPKYNGGSITYYDKSGKARIVNLSDTIDIIYNGRGVYEAEESMIEDADIIELIDNSGDSGYDVIRILNCEPAVISGVDYSQSKIYFKYLLTDGSSFIYLGDAEERDISLKDIDGNSIDITSVSKDDVISLIRDTENKNISAEVSSAVEEGVLERFEERTDDTYITVNGSEYRYSKNAESQEYYGKLRPGERYIFRLDRFGRIADVSPSDGSVVKYGFLADAAVQGAFGDEVVLLMFLPGEGGLQTIKCADRVKIDGTVFLNGKEAVEALKTNSLGASAVKVMPKPVKYLKNSDGEISMLNTPRMGADEAKEPIDFVRYTGFAGGSYNTETHVFAGQVRVGANTKIFCVPLNEEDCNDRTKYVLKDYNYLRGRVYPSATENMEVFGVSKDMTAEVIVLYQENIGGTEIDQNTPITVVSNIIQAVNKAGEVVSCIEGWEKGVKVTVNASSEFDADLTKYYNGLNGEIIASKVRKGDIIRYRTNAQGEIEDYDKLFSLRDEDNPKYVLKGNEADKVGMPDSHESLLAVSTGKYSANGYNCNRIFSHNNENNYIFGAQLVGSFGKVKERVDNNLIVTGTLNNGKVFQEFCDTSKMKILTIDEGKNDVYVSTVDEIKTVEDYGEDEASDVLFFSFSAKSSNLIIVRRQD